MMLAKFKILPQPSAKLLRLQVVRPVETYVFKQGD